VFWHVVLLYFQLHSIALRDCTATQDCYIKWVLHPVQVEVIDSVTDYLATLKEVFDFPTLKEFVGRKDFSFCFDAMNAVTGAYAAPIFVNELGADKNVVM